jgi:hypothetical protein
MKTICLCGSTKFRDVFLSVGSELTLKGNIVLMPLVFSHVTGQHINAQQLDILVQVHNQKIAMSDAILVINVDGYIGSSTAKEIEYARSLGKPVEYLE